MTVAELIKFLKKFPDDCEVLIDDDDRGTPVAIRSMGTMASGAGTSAILSSGPLGPKP
jgi:hypothetical protein